jgi:hypothetical protein
MNTATSGQEAAMARHAPNLARRRTPGPRPLLSALALAAGVVGPAPGALAQNGTVYLSPWSVGQAPMVDFAITVVADGAVPAVSCYALTLDYDRSKLQLVSAQEGSLFTDAPEPTFFSRETDELGRDVLTNCLLGFGTTVTPAGALATLTFRGLTTAISSVELAEAVLRDANRAVIPGVAVQGTVVSIGTVDVPSLSSTGRLRLRAEPNPAGGQVRLVLEGGRMAGPTRSGVPSPLTPAAVTRISIHDIAGRRVRSLETTAGSLIWDGCDAEGRPAASGVYFALATTAAGEQAMAKLIRLE